MPTQTYPYSDSTMTYSLEDHRYVLTPAYVRTKTGIDLLRVLNPGFSAEPQQLVSAWLDQLSLEIYTWIYEFNRNNPIQEYMLAKHPILRDYIRTAMIQQVLYVLKDGDLNMYSGVNVKNGQIIDKKLLVQAAIAPNAQRELNRIVPGWEIAITYQGQINTPIGFRPREDY